MIRTSQENMPDILPAGFLERLPRILSGEDCSLYLEYISKPLPLSIRVVHPSLSRMDIVKELESAGLSCHLPMWMPEAIRLSPADRRMLSMLSEDLQNRVFVQSLSSMAAVESLDVHPGHDVLDCCAAPGGKSSLIRYRQKGQGILVANDLSRRRALRMRRVFELHGLTDIDIQINDAQTLGATFDKCFDRVLLDAPCSGEGRFNIHESVTFSDWNPGKVRRLGKLQNRLLKSALRTLRPGGLLLYATCTLSPEENECVLQKVLSRESDNYVIEPIEIPFDGRRPALAQWNGEEFSSWMQEAVRIVPQNDMTPFFLAAIRKR